VINALTRIFRQPSENASANQSSLCGKK